MKSRTSLSKTVVSAAGMFGGTQVVAMLGSMLRTKLVALWIGEAGIGLFGLFNSIVELVGSLTQLNLRNSSVREISENAESHSGRKLSQTVSAVRRWGWALGLIGALVMAGFSPLLALSAFGDSSVVWPFLMLSVAVLLNSASEAEKAVLQGLHRLKPLARAMTWGVIAGCLVSVPMIWFWRIDSVAPVVVAYSAIVFLVTWFCRDRNIGSSGGMSVRQTVHTGRRFMKLGLFMTVTSVTTYGSNYFFLTFLNLTGGADVMGQYQAGYTLLVKYVGFLTLAVSMEYYPRLSAAASRGLNRLRVFMNHETRMLSLMTSIPAVIIAALSPLAVNILYTSDFTAVPTMVSLGAPGLVLRAASGCVAFTVLAKGDGPTYIKCELTSVCVGLALNVTGYLMWGIAGVGASFTLWYLLYYLMMVQVVRCRYSVTVAPVVSLLVLLSTVAVCAVGLTSLFGGRLIGGLLGLVVAVGCGWLLARRRR